MATIASRRPAWRLPARVAGRPRLLALLGLGALVALSVLLRTQDLGVGFWIDEGLSVGIADRPLSDIPGVLRLDGSPPLYYSLLHVWIAVFGRSEEITHALSLLFAVLTVPAAWWAVRGLFGDRAAWIAALLAATNPFLTQYAQETRMYALLVLLGTLACGAFARAFVFTEFPHRRRWAAAFGVALSAMFYTHNWSLFFAFGCALSWLVLLVTTPRPGRREELIDGLITFGVVLLLWLPWLPTFAYQLQHTGAPWSNPPDSGDLIGVPSRLLGGRGQYVLLLAAGAGLVALLNRREGQLSPRARALLAFAGVAVLTVLAAFVASQISPAWASRYLAVAVPPFLIAVACALAHASRLGVVGALLVALLWVGDGAPTDKSNVRDVAEAVAPSLRPGDLVVSTQPEQIPVLHYYLPDGLRYATLWGAVRDTGVTDWRDGVPRMRATSAAKDLAPLLDRLPSGGRVLLVEPQITSLTQWRAPWTQLVRVRSTEWTEFLANDPRFTAIAERPEEPVPGIHPVVATVFVKG